MSELSDSMSKSSLLDSYDSIRVFEGFPQNKYLVSFPALSENEKPLFSFCINAIKSNSLDSSASLRPSKDFLDDFSKLLELFDSKKAVKVFLEPEETDKLKKLFAELIEKHFPKTSNLKRFASLVIDESIGFSFLAPLMEDKFLEEIMVNGPEKPVFVFHRRFGLCKTNIVFTELKLNSLIEKIAFTVRRKFSFSNPLLDARLPDGSRINATNSFVTPFGSSLTIRKFSPLPLSIINLIENKTFSSELAAFLWLMVEGMDVEPMNIIISGGSGTGKTTTLNVLCSFIRFRERIVSIEDTLELHLGKRENWVQMESKNLTEENKEISMNDLLKNSLRMRPDRILLGEVRGPEAQTLFTAMDTGHKGCLGTLHSNSSHELLLRLKSYPMNVPESMIPLLDLIIMQSKFYFKGTGIIRKVTYLTEVTSMDGKPLLANIFEWDKTEDKIKRTKVPSHTLDVLSERLCKTKKEILQEMGVRKRILDWMQEHRITSNSEVEALIQSYYFDPESILEQVVENKKPDLKQIIFGPAGL
ncbi:MAG: ATPase, T2SS/T4P/T4SS family [Candidatus Diapherotrites archaeon]